MVKWEGRVSRAEVIVNAQSVPLGIKYFGKGENMYFEKGEIL